jgi:tetratricopeptide (TPR) repeat protein
MDEIKILSLLAEGENNRVDFKRELKLDSAQDKAEFIKDVISLANSSTNVGYLLFGVDDDKYIVGISQLPEEQIQQIAYTYITPTPKLNCFIVPVDAPTLPLVGVIEIRAVKKPYKVARAIEKLNQDDVFIRRGSVVAKPSPEEIVEMYHNSREKYNKEKTKRLERVKSFGFSNEYPWEEKEKDLEWLKANTEGYELGEVLYWEVDGWEARNEMKVAKQAKPLLDKAISLGYKTPEIHFLRAQANISLCNYGFALEDIDEAITMSYPNDSQAKYYALKAEILIEMNKYEEAYQALSDGKKIDEKELLQWLYLVKSDFDNSLLYRYVLAYEFGQNTIREPMNMVIKAIILWNMRQVVELTREPDGKILTQTELNHLNRKNPWLLRSIRKILGEKLWVSLINDEDITLKFRFPTLTSQIPEKW